MEDLDEEQRQDMEQHMKTIREEALARMFIKTHQGVVRQSDPPLKLISDDKVTFDSLNPSLAIQKVNDHCVDASATSSFASI